MGVHFNNAGWSGAVTGFRALAGMANALLAAKLLGPKNYGHLAALLSVFAFYLSLNKGFYTVLVGKLMSPVTAKDPHARSEILSSALLLTAGSIVLLALLTSTAYWISPVFLGSFKSPITGLTFMMMGVVVAVQIVAALLEAIIEAAGRLDLAMKAQLIGPFLLLILLGTSYVLHLSLIPQDYVLMLGAAASVDLVLLWMTRRVRLRLPVLLGDGFAGMARLKELLGSGGMLQAALAMNLFLEPLNKLLLNYFTGPIAVTAYDFAMKMIWGIQGLFGAAMRVFLHFAKEDGAVVGQIYTRAISLVAVPALIMHTVGTIFLSWVANHWMNIDASRLLVFYAIATLSNLGMIFASPFYTSLISRSDLRFIFRTQAILALSNTIISIIMIPLFGLIGAAIGLLGATIYNARAIYIRHGHLVGQLDGMLNMCKQVAARFFVTGGLFAIALFLGIQGKLEKFWSIVLLVSLFAVGMTESLTRRFLVDMLPMAIFRDKKK